MYLKDHRIKKDKKDFTKIYIRRNDKNVFTQIVIMNLLSNKIKDVLFAQILQYIPLFSTKMQGCIVTQTIHKSQKSLSDKNVFNVIFYFYNFT